jgi:hypothetical protein
MVVARASHGIRLVERADETGCARVSRRIRTSRARFAAPGEALTRPFTGDFAFLAGEPELADDVPEVARLVGPGQTDATLPARAREAQRSNSTAPRVPALFTFRRQRGHRTAGA